jgi:hypothetical protein
LLPTFRRSVKVGSVSSYDRSGGNDDGFNGTYSFVRKETAGLVIADLKGPGVIYRIWTPTPTDDVVEFYFDGEASPRIRIKFRDLFTGSKAPFLSPVVGIGAGGFYSYLPLPYKESCKVLVKADRVMFYQINYATFAADSHVESFAAAPSKEFDEHLDKARRMLASTGSDLSAYAAPGGAPIQTRSSNQSLAPGKAVTIFQTDRPGRVLGLRLGPARAFAGKARDVRIRAYWDGESGAAIDCPVGDLFGYSFGQPAVKSLLLGTTDDMNYVYLPMPFDKSARIELVSDKPTGAAISVQSEVKFTNVGRRADEGRLYAVWRRENPTAAGRPFTFVETRGRGHVVGFILQAQGMEPGGIPEFFEGDDQTTIDGETVIHGTGSEDFFNGGWYDVPGRWETRVSLPLSGSLDFKRHLGRTGGYRFMLTDVYSFKESILSTIEHGPAGNRIPTDYTSVTFLYSENTPTGNPGLPPLEERGVKDPQRVVFTSGWTTPIHAFSWSNAVLMKRDDKIGGDGPFVEWLDAFFGDAKGDERLRPEGLYTQVNESDILAAFLYIHAGRADRTQAQVRRLMRREYRTGRAGLPGNDDAGTMSSWYVWNAVGLYPNAGQSFYYVGSPLFTSVAINLGGGRTFTIEARGASATNMYVLAATLDGRRLDRAWLTHAEVSRGGRLILQMSDKPSHWGSANRPPSVSPPTSSVGHSE